MALADSRTNVVVIGGGLAGLTAALDLAATGIKVTLIEARAWLGGATCSFARHGLTIDNGQHAYLRCCRAYLGLLDQLGVMNAAGLQDQLTIAVLATGGQADISRSRLPAPLQLAPALARYSLLTRAERIRVAAGFAALPVAGRSRRSGVTFGSWLARHGQGEPELGRLWDPLCVLATGLPAVEADVAVAARTISAALLGGRGSADVGVPRVPLSQLHAAPATAELASRGTTVITSCRAVAVEPVAHGGYAVRCDTAAGGAAAGGDSRLIEADGVIVAVPPWDAMTILPARTAAGQWAGLEPVPVVSLHVMYEHPVTSLPVAVITGSPVRWVADKTAAAGLHSGQYLAATICAADRYVDQPASQLRATLLPELARAFPAAAGIGVQDFFVTRERRARVRRVPGAAPAREIPDPLPATLALAGAWTDVRWPDTMEGAVRSGRAAAAKLAAGLGAGRAESASPAAADRQSADITGTGELGEAAAEPGIPIAPGVSSTRAAESSRAPAL